MKSVLLPRKTLLTLAVRFLSSSSFAGLDLARSLHSVMSSKLRLQEIYDGFRNILIDKSTDRTSRPELRRVVAALVETIVLDPHCKDGSWCYNVHLKGANESVEIVCKAKPQSWRYFNPRRQDCALLNGNFIAA